MITTSTGRKRQRLFNSRHTKFWQQLGFPPIYREPNPRWLAEASGSVALGSSSLPQEGFCYMEWSWRFRSAAGRGPITYSRLYLLGPCSIPALSQTSCTCSVHFPRRAAALSEIRQTLVTLLKVNRVSLMRGPFTHRASLQPPSQLHIDHHISLASYLLTQTCPTISITLNIN